jgi:hypothetical protein
VLQFPDVDEPTVERSHQDELDAQHEPGRTDGETESPCQACHLERLLSETPRQRNSIFEIS